jgi:hypothetical protein
MPEKIKKSKTLKPSSTPRNLQRAAITPAPDIAPPIVHEVLRSPGQPLDAETRAFMEPRFGHDFSQIQLRTIGSNLLHHKLTVGRPDDQYEQEVNRAADAIMSAPAVKEDDVCSISGFSHVRLHTDSAAAESARIVHARAYTVGQDVVFGAGQYAPATSAGQRLLAHELGHVVQQRNGAPVLQRNSESVGELPTIQLRNRPVSAGRRSRQQSTSEVLPRVDVSFQDGTNRWMVTIDGILVAEVAVANKETPLEIRVDITDSAATITMRHHGDASLAAASDPGATIRYSLTLCEIDMREGPPNRAGPTPPPVAGERATGTVDISIAGRQALRWPDEPIGELAIGTPIPPGALSEFEHQLRDNPNLINGVVMDPDHPGEAIGYRVFATAGVTRLVDREGTEVFLDEIGIETPLLDPLDFIPTPGTVGKVGAGIIGRVGVKALGRRAAVQGTRIPLGVVARMRSVSRALFSRAARKGAEEAPGLVRRITKAGLDHSFDRHAAQWFGRTVSRNTHMVAWRELVERVAASSQTFPWSTGAAKTIGHLGRVEGKYFVVQFFEETGELASAFVPNSRQLREMLKLLKGAP